MGEVTLTSLKPTRLSNISENKNIIFVMERWKLEVFRMGCYLMFPGVMMYLFNTNYHMNNYFIPYLKKTDRNAYTNLTGDYEDEEEKKRMTRFNN